MLAISVNKEFLDIEKISITFELKSPVFNEIGSFSYPFNLPATARNKRILSHPGRINNAVFHQHFDSEIHFGGMLWKTGRLFVKEVTDNTIKAYFTVGEGYFYNEIKDLRLKDVDLGGQRFTINYGTGVDLYAGIYENQYPDVDFAIFPVANAGFWKDTPHELYYQQQFNAVNYWDSNLKLSKPKNTFVFYPYVNYLLKQAFANLNAELVNGFSNDPFLKNLCLYSNNPQNDYYMDGDEFKMNAKFSFYLNDSLSDTTLSELISALEKTFSANLFYDAQQNRYHFKFLKNILQSEPVAINNSFRLTELKYERKNGYSLEWQYDDDDEVSKNGKEDILRFNYKGVVYDFGNLPDDASIGDLYFIEIRGEYAVWEDNPNRSGTQRWRLINYPYQAIESGDKKIIINPQAGIAYNNFSARNEEYKPGNHGLESEIKSFPPKFFIYRGMVNGKPMGNTVHTLPFSGPYSLHWHGESGLYENFWKLPLDFYQRTMPATYRIAFSQAELQLIDFSKIYRFDNTNWLFSSVKVSISNQGISPAEVVVYKV